MPVREFRALRREAELLRDRHLSIRTIAGRLGVSKSLVGKWLHGYGEAFWELRCENPECGKEIVAMRAERMFCDRRCQKRAKALEVE